MDVPDSLLQFAKIKILVLPVGNISNEKFDYFYKLLNHFNVISLQDLTPDFSAGFSIVYC